VFTIILRDVAFRLMLNLGRLPFASVVSVYAFAVKLNTVYVVLAARPVML
jgi:hypothetical protein